MNIHDAAMWALAGMMWGITLGFVGGLIWANRQRRIATDEVLRRAAQK